MKRHLTHKETFHPWRDVLPIKRRFTH